MKRTDIPVMLIAVALAVTGIAVPMYEGKIPARPRKGGDGWLPAIDMHANPTEFWRYLACFSMTWPMLFGMYLVATGEKDDYHRGIFGLVMFVGGFALSFYFS